MSTTTTHAHHPPKENIKETLISILIAFVLAFVFRSFVVEAFIIPTGSMAPTLMGAHMRFTSEETGLNWAVGPWYYNDPRGQDPKAVQGNAAERDRPVVVNDPFSGEAISEANVPLRSGDRILVLKYLYALRDPERFDVVVFKNTNDPSVNYIKRLIGLPGEQIALVDGDVFTRPASAGALPGDATAWDQPGWRIARKPARVEKAVWQPVFDSAMTPVDAGPGHTVANFRMPWAGSGDSWKVGPGDGGERGVFTYSGKARTSLAWDSQASWIRLQQPDLPRVDLSREIVDRYPYNNQAFAQPPKFYPVSDVRCRAGVQPDASVADERALSCRVILTARGHEFVGEIVQGVATVKMRPAPTVEQTDPPWTVLGTGPAVLPPGKVTNVEFWHVDQSAALVVDGRVAARGEYDWTPAQRIAFATGKNLADILGSNNTPANALADPSLYRKPRLRWEFEGGPLRLYRVALDRDLYYQPANYNRGPSVGLPALATHPAHPTVLGADQFFVCGDNSPASEDGRLWPPPDAWVDDLMAQRGMQSRVGVVPRDLMLGKAFFVYFPSLVGGKPVPVPDFGRLRFIN